MTDQILTQSRLKEVLHYCPETGVFTWIVKNHKINIGDNAGCKANQYSKTYLLIGVDMKLYRAHRLAWLYVHGSFPKEQIDHIDGNGSNNKILNLRSVSLLENFKNIRKREDNTSGVTGVFWHTRDNKWNSVITCNKKRTSLGYFIDFFEAVCARKSAENRLGFHVNHGSIRPL